MKTLTSPSFCLAHQNLSLINFNSQLSRYIVICAAHRLPFSAALFEEMNTSAVKCLFLAAGAVLCRHRVAMRNGRRRWRAADQVIVRRELISVLRIGFVLLKGSHRVFDILRFVDHRWQSDIIVRENIVQGGTVALFDRDAPCVVKRFESLFVRFTAFTESVSGKCKC